MQSQYSTFVHSYVEFIVIMMNVIGCFLLLNFAFETLVTFFLLQSDNFEIALIWEDDFCFMFSH